MKKKQQSLLKIGQILAVLAISSMFMLAISFDAKMQNWSFVQGFLGLIGLVFLWKMFSDEKINMIGVLVGLVLLLFVQIVASWKTTMAIEDLRYAVYFVMAAVCEELFFRGVLITPAIRSKNAVLQWTAVLLSSVAFTFIHFNYWHQNDRLFLVFFSGVVLGYIYIQFQSITTNILCHLFINLIAVGSVMYV